MDIGGTRHDEHGNFLIEIHCTGTFCLPPIHRIHTRKRSKNNVELRQDDYGKAKLALMYAVENLPHPSQRQHPIHVCIGLDPDQALTPPFVVTAPKTHSAPTSCEKSRGEKSARP